MNYAARKLVTISASAVIGVIVLIAWIVFSPITDMFVESLGPIAYVPLGLLAFFVWYSASDHVWVATGGDKKESG